MYIKNGIDVVKVSKSPKLTFRNIKSTVTVRAHYFPASDALITLDFECFLGDLYWKNSTMRIQIN